MTRLITTGLVLLAALLGWAADSAAQTAKHYRFAYDQPKNTGYGLVGEIFASKLAELSKNTMLIDQYPGAQLGQEPQVLQLVKSGDIDFCISSSANAATLSPQSGVMSLHFLFKSEDHLKKSLADPRLADRVADNLFRAQKFEGTESETLIIGRGFGTTTDIEQGPDGNLYVVSITDNAIYKISRR